MEPIRFRCHGAAVFIENENWPEEQDIHESMLTDASIRYVEEVRTHGRRAAHIKCVNGDAVYVLSDKADVHGRYRARLLRCTIDRSK